MIIAAGLLENEQYGHRDPPLLSISMLSAWGAERHVPLVHYWKGKADSELEYTFDLELCQSLESTWEIPPIWPLAFVCMITLEVLQRMDNSLCIIPTNLPIQS